MQMWKKLRFHEWNSQVQSPASRKQSQTQPWSSECLLPPGMSICPSLCLSVCPQILLTVSVSALTIHIHKCGSEEHIACQHTGLYWVVVFLEALASELWVLSQWLESRCLASFVCPKCPLLSNHSYLVQKYPQHMIRTHMVSDTK